MIRIMLVDDHAAVRAGLEKVLDHEPDLVPVASTEGQEDLWPRFHLTRPDLVLLDFHLPGQSSVSICRRLKAIVPAPHVVFYSAYAGAGLAVPLRLAGADGIVSKAARPAELVEVVRRVAAGTRCCRRSPPGFSVPRAQRSSTRTVLSWRCSSTALPSPTSPTPPATTPRS